MKSLANDVLNIALGIFQDIQVAYPDYAGIVLDQNRLSRLVQTRDLTVFTLDLPCLDTLLLQGLEHGRILPSGPVSKPISKKVRVPRFLSGLWLRVFDKEGVLLSDVDVNAVLFLRQIFCLGKKLALKCSPQRLEKALEEYANVEGKLRKPTFSWDSEEFHSRSGFHRVHFCDVLDDALPLFGEEPNRGEHLRSRRLLERCQRVADILSVGIGPYDPYVYSDKRVASGRSSGLKHGPGAVAERSGRSFDKFEFSNWTRKLSHVFPYTEFAFANSRYADRPLMNHEVPSRLVAVPKTAKTMRLIAAEPSEHMFCQQLTKTFLVERLKMMFGTDFICFERQDLSQDMARRGSLDGSLATIDLQSASDRLSCFAVERLFRRNPTLLQALHATRTRWLVDAVGSEKRYFRLRKFAAQGTAVTFPVQSIFFLCIALGACIDGKVTFSKIMRLKDKVRVFGDDIIVPSHRYADVVHSLHCLGLKVNEDKSFFKGLFREACGGDFFKGYDVTPLKPECLTSDGTTSWQSIIDTTNNLYLKGYWNASDRLNRSIDGRVFKNLPIKGPRSGYTGLVSYTAGSWTPPDRMVRWNRHLQRYEIRTLDCINRAGSREYSEHSALLAFFMRGSIAVISNGYISMGNRLSDGESLYCESGIHPTIAALRLSSKRTVTHLLNPTGSVLGYAERPRPGNRAGWVDLNSFQKGF